LLLILVFLDYVLSLISDAYLKSKNCMYEICELMRDRNYMDRSLFIVLSDDDINKYCNREQGGAHIFNDADSINYNLYWANKAREYKGKIDQIPEGKAKTTLENTYHMFTTINDNLASFINQLKTRLCVILIIRIYLDSWNNSSCYYKITFTLHTPKLCLSRSSKASGNKLSHL